MEMAISPRTPRTAPVKNRASLRVRRIAILPIWTRSVHDSKRTLHRLPP
jgi:hypothetical protein